MQRLEIKVEHPSGTTSHHYIAPANWDEMTKYHLLAWAKVIGTNMTIVRAKRFLFILMFRIPKLNAATIPLSQLNQQVHRVNFLFKRNRLQKWLIPSIYHFCLKYYGPKNQLANLTVEEYKLTELCYEQYQNTKNIEYINTLVAILYRPRRYFNIDNDIRCSLTNYGYIKRAKRFKNLSLKLRYAIYLNYEGCHNFIIDNNPDVFNMSGSKVSVQKQLTPWSKIIESAAGGKFGTMKETKSSNLHEFLSELGSRIREQREYERVHGK
ncbi:hypothetical protein [Mucilaginibacter sp.]